MSEVIAPYIGKLTTFLGWDGVNFRAVAVNGAGQIETHVITSALPTGAATAAKQDTQTTALQSIQNLVGALNDVGLDELRVLVAKDGAAWLPLHVTAVGDVFAICGEGPAGQRTLTTDNNGHLQIDILTSALPTGAATSANQASILTALSTPKLIQGSGLMGPLIADSRWSTVIGAGASAALFDSGSGHSGQVLTFYIMFDGIADAAKWSSISFSVDGGAYAGLSMFSAGYFVQWAAKQYPWMECLTWDNAGFKYEFWFNLPFTYSDRIQGRVTNSDGANASTYSYAVFYTKA